MSSFTVTIDDKELMREINRTVSEGKVTLDKALYATAQETGTIAKKSISAHKSSGVTYKRGGVFHTASKEGFPPNKDTGALVANITVEKDGDGYNVGSRDSAQQGVYMEFGTSKVGARPWLRPAVDEAIKKMVEKLRGK